MYKILFLMIPFLISACFSQQNLLVFNGHQCFPRTGNCVKASFDNQEVVPIGDKSVLEEYKGHNYYLTDVEWEVIGPVSKDPEIQVGPQDGTEGWFGAFEESEIEFIALDDQDIQSTPELAQEDSVRVGGKAVIVEQDVFRGSKYPAGNYLFFLKVKGTKNWDRQTIFVTIR